MASINVLAGQATLTINNNTFTGFADNDIITVTFPNELLTIDTGKNGNSIFAQNTSGFQGEISFRLLLNCPDDKFMNSILIAQNTNFSGFSLMSGQIVLPTGDGQGNVINKIYNLSGGAIMNQPEGKSNVKGETEQAVTVYKLRFSNVVITIS